MLIFCVQCDSAVLGNVSSNTSLTQVMWCRMMTNPLSQQQNRRRRSFKQWPFIHTQNGTEIKRDRVAGGCCQAGWLEIFKLYMSKNLQFKVQSHSVWIQIVPHSLTVVFRILGKRSTLCLLLFVNSSLFALNYTTWPNYIQEHTSKMGVSVQNPS